ncbi:MAG TPA: S-layer homology domain-containing protein [Thermoanaerobaculia bacterium]|jgi:hypothetical protein|nr:S-layer homology domain-containing protein [Thermoanaerobaculia bacterium]
MRKRLILIAPLLLLIPLRPLAATSVRPPANLGQLVRISEAVVLAQAVESWVEAGDTIPYTVTRFQQLEQVAGRPTGSLFELREPGGSLGRIGVAVAGAPRFTPGHNYLLFLDRAPDGRWRSRMMAYGLLEEAAGGSRLRPLAAAADLEVLTPTKSFEPVGVYGKRALLDHLRAVARGARWDRRRAAAQPLAAGAAPLIAKDTGAGGPPDCVYLDDGTANHVPLRWFGYEDGSTTATVLPTTPGQVGIADGGVAAVQEGTAAWRNAPNSVIQFQSGSPRASNIACSGDFDYDRGGVIFNDPCNDLADLTSDCVGTLAFGGPIYDNTSTRMYDGQPWHPILAPFVVINNGTQCVGEVSFKEVLTHELGHTQGFGHHTPANPADATMSAMLKGDGRGASLGPTDKICASFDYHTFLDVPYSHMFWRYIEAVQNAGIARGCSAANYCPDDAVSRAQMAVFLVRGSHGSSFSPPPASGTMFADVPSDFWAASFVEQLATDGITRGCGNNLFCPNATVTRAQMAIFLVRARHGSGFVPPPASGTVFADVPADYWAASFVEQLYADGVTGGCATNPRRYCPEDDATRGEMATFLARTYNLPLP